MEIIATQSYLRREYESLMRRLNEVSDKALREKLRKKNDAFYDMVPKNEYKAEEMLREIKEELKKINASFNFKDMKVGDSIVIAAPIHTHIPKVHKEVLVKNLNIFTSGLYNSSKNKVAQAQSLKLTDIGNFGAVLNLIMPDNEVVPLFKKKLRWSELVLLLFNIDSLRDAKTAKEYGNELMKHGVINFH